MWGHVPERPERLSVCSTLLLLLVSRRRTRVRCPCLGAQPVKGGSLTAFAPAREFSVMFFSAEIKANMDDPCWEL